MTLSETLQQQQQQQKQNYAEDFDGDEGLAMLVPDIHCTTYLVCEATEQFTDTYEQDERKEMIVDNNSFASNEERYLKIMKGLQFGKN